MRNPSKKSISETVNSHKIYRKGDLLSINIAPSVKYQYFDVQPFATFMYNKRRESFLKKWQPIINMLHVTNKKFVLESSKYGLLHFHGWVIIDDPKEFACQVGFIKYRMGCEIEIDTIDNIDDWEEYIMKDNDVHQCVIKDEVKQNTLEKYLKRKPKKGIKTKKDK